MERNIDNPNKRIGIIPMHEWFEPQELLINQQVYHPMKKDQVLALLASVKPRKLIEDWNM